jgi:hypothetical protein
MPKFWTHGRGYNSFCSPQNFLESLLCHEKLFINFHNPIYEVSQTYLPQTLLSRATSGWYSVEHSLKNTVGEELLIVILLLSAQGGQILPISVIQSSFIARMALFSLLISGHHLYPTPVKKIQSQCQWRGLTTLCIKCPCIHEDPMNISVKTKLIWFLTIMLKNQILFNFIYHSRQCLVSIQ